MPESPYRSRERQIQAHLDACRDAHIVMEMLREKMIAEGDGPSEYRQQFLSIALRLSESISSIRNSISLLPKLYLLKHNTSGLCAVFITSADASFARFLLGDTVSQPQPIESTIPIPEPIYSLIFAKDITHFWTGSAGTPLASHLHQWAYNRPPPPNCGAPHHDLYSTHALGQSMGELRVE